MGKVTLEQCSDWNIAAKAARRCYDSDSDGGARDMNLLKRAVKMGHESVMEHLVYTFNIGEISRACAQQLTRHRIASPTMRSQRYVKEKEPQYVTPPSIQGGALHLYEDTMWMCWDSYMQLIEMGVPKEDARYVLPNACRTDLYFTINFRSLLNFLRLRMDKHAQWEIRQLAEGMFSTLPAEHKELLIVGLSEVPR